MRFNDFVSWGFQGLISGAVLYGVNQLGALRGSIEELNKQFARMMEKSLWHEKELNRHDSRISDLERHHR